MPGFDFISQSTWFIISVILAFFIPGNLILSRLSLTKTQRISIGLTVGIVFWAIQGYVFGYLGIRWASYIYLLIALGIQAYLIFKNKISFSQKFKINPFPISIIFLIIVGVLVYSSPLWMFGIISKEGMNLCCRDVRDNLLHISYIHQIIKNFPPMEPGLFDKEVTNYHYWMHIVVAELIRVFKLPMIDTSMRFIPILFSLLFTLLLVSFGQILKLKNTLIAWILFFFIFSADFIYIVNFIFKVDPLFKNTLSTSTFLFINYPFAGSMIVALGALNLLALYLIKKDKRILILIGILIGTIIGFKVNTAFFMLGGLGILTAYKFFKKEFDYIAILFISLITTLFVFLPPNASSGGLIYTGFWRAQDFITSLGLTRMELARKVYLDSGNYIKVGMYNFFFASIYAFGLFGTRFVAFFQTKKSLKTFPFEINLFLISAIFVSIFVGFFFIQKTGGANSMFFIHTGLIFLNFYMALSVFYWSSKFKRIPKYIFITLIIIFTIPTSVNYILESFSPPDAYINADEMNAMKFLREKTPADSLLFIIDNSIDRESSHITFIADRPSFLSGQNNELTAHSIPYPNRDKLERTVLKSRSKNKVLNAIRKSDADYVYINTSTVLKCNCKDSLNKVYSNKTVDIFKVDK